jgi:lysylphosphatidylglycerol synthetase-like protein (DUF2156 family)
MSRSKYIPMTAVRKTLLIFITGFAVAWMALMIVPPPAAATRLGFAARIVWPILHLVLTTVLVLGGGLMLRTLRGSGVPQSKRSRKMGWICCGVTLILALAYAGSIVALSRDNGSPKPSTTQNANPVEQRT